MLPLELKFLTEDPRLIELARLYWELDQEEKVFPHHLKGLAPRFAVPANKILKTVMQNCEASIARDSLRDVRAGETLRFTKRLSGGAEALQAIR